MEGKFDDIDMFDTIPRITMEVFLERKAKQEEWRHILWLKELGLNETSYIMYAVSVHR